MDNSGKEEGRCNLTRERNENGNEDRNEKGHYSTSTMEGKNCEIVK
jgi:hypothetical protein